MNGIESEHARKRSFACLDSNLGPELGWCVGGSRAVNSSRLIGSAQPHEATFSLNGPLDSWCVAHTHAYFARCRKKSYNRWPGRFLLCHQLWGFPQSTKTGRVSNNRAWTHSPVCGTEGRPHRHRIFWTFADVTDMMYNLLLSTCKLFFQTQKQRHALKFRFFCFAPELWPTVYRCYRKDSRTWAQTTFKFRVPTIMQTKKRQQKRYLTLGFGFTHGNWGIRTVAKTVQTSWFLVEWRQVW